LPKIQLNKVRQNYKRRRKREEKKKEEEEEEKKEKRRRRHWTHCDGKALENIISLI